MTISASPHQTPDRRPNKSPTRAYLVAFGSGRGWAWMVSLGSLCSLMGCAERGPFLGGVNRNQELVLRNAALEAENRDLQRQLASMRDTADQIETELAELRRRESFMTAGRRGEDRLQDGEEDFGFDSQLERRRDRDAGAAKGYRRPPSRETEQDWRTPDNSPMADAREDPLDSPSLSPSSSSSGTGTRRAAGSLEATPDTPPNGDDPPDGSGGFELHDLFSNPNSDAGGRLPPPDADPGELASRETDWQTPSLRATLQPSDSSARSMTASDSSMLAQRRSEPAANSASSPRLRSPVRSGSTFPNAPWPDDSPLRRLPGAEIFREPSRTPWLNPSPSSDSPSRPSPRAFPTPSRSQ